jgi:hypothetical protein
MQRAIGMAPLLQHGRRVDGDVDGIRRDALAPHLIFGEMISAQGHAVPFHGRGAFAGFDPTRCAVFELRFAPHGRFIFRFTI